MLSTTELLALGGMVLSGTVKFTNPKDYVFGQIKVEFDNGQTELVGFDTLDLI